MTPPIMPEPNPRLTRLNEYADILREFAGDTSGDPDVRDLVRLARLAFKQEHELLSVERIEESRRERKGLSAGAVAATAVGGIEGLSGLALGVAGAKLGALAGAPLGPAGAAVGGVVGGLGGATAGMLGVQPAMRATGVATSAQLEETMGQNPWFHLGGVTAGGVGPSLVRFVGNKMALSAAKAVTARANAAVAERVAAAQAARVEAQATRAQLELADLQRKMAHPQRPAASAARYREIQERSRRAIAEANRAEWESVMAQQRAQGQLSPLEARRLEVIGRQIQQADLRIEMMRQQAEAGTLRPAQAKALLERTTQQVRVLENQVTRSGAQAGIAAEEATVRLTTMKERLKLLQQLLREQNLLPEPPVMTTPGVMRQIAPQGFEVSGTRVTPPPPTGPSVAEIVHPQVPRKPTP